jgi:hypothetical protein
MKIRPLGNVFLKNWKRLWKKEGKGKCETEKQKGRNKK